MEEKRALLRFVPAWNGPVTAVRPPDRGLEPAPYRFGRPLSRVPFEACWPDARTTRARPRPRLSSPSHRSTSILSSIHISSLSLTTTFPSPSILTGESHDITFSRPFPSEHRQYSVHNARDCKFVDFAFPQTRQGEPRGLPGPETPHTFPTTNSKQDRRLTPYFA